MQLMSLPESQTTPAQRDAATKLINVADVYKKARADVQERYKGYVYC